MHQRELRDIRVTVHVHSGTNLIKKWKKYIKLYNSYSCAESVLGPKYQYRLDGTKRVTGTKGDKARIHV